MFKKIHSNRNPGATIYREIKKEFSVYFARADAALSSFLARYPKPVFVAMTVLIVVSMVLSFTIFRKTAPGTNGNPKSIMPVGASAPGGLTPAGSRLDQILQTTSDLKETLALKTEVETLLAKKTLTKADSLVLEKALDRLGQFHNHLILKK
jgi:hypothetical protein